MTSPAASRTLADLVTSDGLALLRFAYLLCGDRQLAEDLLQDVLLSMHRRFPDRLALDNPPAYARRALANANVSRTRRRSSAEITLASLPETWLDNDEDPGARDLLWRALRRLPVRQRTVLVLRFYADWTDDTIAEAIGARRGTVRSLASRALATLREDPSLSGTDDIRVAPDTGAEEGR
jgi:RNA polymerase sigma-70 factor (sigma-E family)